MTILNEITKSLTNPQSKLYHDMNTGSKLEEHTLEVTDELVSRLKYNQGHVTTLSSRKVIKYGIEQFVINPHPQQIRFSMNALANCKYKNVAISELIIHLYYLQSWRYFFKLIGRPPHRFSDLLKLALVGNDDVKQLFIDKMSKIHDHKEFIKFMWDVRATLDFDEMMDLNTCSKYWRKHPAHLNTYDETEILI